MIQITLTLNDLMSKYKIKKDYDFLRLLKRDNRYFKINKKEIFRKRQTLK